MSHRHIWQPSPDRAQRVKELMLSTMDFAALAGANVGFSPAHPEQWMMFWKEDRCEKDECHMN